MKVKKKIIKDRLTLLRLINSSCACGESREDMLTVDHIVPKRILIDFGLTTEQMFELKLLKILCRRCNSMKADHLDFSEPRTKEILKYLIDTYL